MALRCGIPNELFWELSIPEVEAVVNQWSEEQRAKSLRAGLIAAAVYNVHLKKGARQYKATDFVKMPNDFMRPEEAQSYMDGWAKDLGAVEGPPVDVDAERAKLRE